MSFNDSNYPQGYNDSVNGAFGVANDAFFYGDNLSRFFKEWYDFDVGKLDLIVHYGYAMNILLNLYLVPKVLLK